MGKVGRSRKSIADRPAFGQNDEEDPTPENWTELRVLQEGAI